MKIGPIQMVTIITKNLEDSAAMYCETFNWRVSRSLNQIASHQAMAWKAENLIGANSIEIAGSNGALRFIEVPDYEEIQPLNTFGWSSLEICVDDVFGYTDRAISAGFKVLNEPVQLAGEDKPLPLIAAQLAGINGEILYITQILDEVPNFELPDVAKESGSIFICVLGASNLEASRAAIENRFEVRRASDREVAIKIINKIFNKPITDLHRLSSLQLSGRNAIEIDQLPASAKFRSFKIDTLPAGISIVTVKGDVSEPLIIELPDSALLEVVP
ncbi:MAG: hypothetical protein QNL07_04060 [Candidatus Planktophila sp.]|jgi:hypothetical protein|tara:strand:- start:1317 stop:2138 length:822 start_codon:yes stop_codon:yes gene_type:complete